METYSFDFFLHGKWSEMHSLKSASFYWQSNYWFTRTEGRSITSNNFLTSFSACLKLFLKFVSDSQAKTSSKSNQNNIKIEVIIAVNKISHCIHSGKLEIFSITSISVSRIHNFFFFHTLLAHFFIHSLNMYL